MPKAVTIIAPFHNLSAGDLAHRLGALEAEIADLEIREKTLRDKLIRRGASEVEGALFRVTVAESVRWTIDAKAVRAEMGEAWVERPLPAISRDESGTNTMPRAANAARRGRGALFGSITQPAR